MPTESSIAARRLSPYPPQALGRFRQILLDRQTNLLHSCAGLSHVALQKAGARSNDDSQVTDDPADLAAAACDQNFSIQMIGRLQAELEEIADALERIQNRSFGTCEECGTPIPETRLEAIPTANTCIPCKSAQENA